MREFIRTFEFHGLRFEFVDFNGFGRELELRNDDDEEIVFHLGPNLVEREVFRKDDRARERTEEAFFDDRAATGFVIDGGAFAFAGNGENISRNRNIDVGGVDSGKRGYERDGIFEVEHVEGDLTDIFFYGIGFGVVMDADFVGPLPGVADIEEFEHGKKFGKTVRDRIRSSRFCKFLERMVFYWKALKLGKKSSLNPLLATETPPGAPMTPTIPNPTSSADKREFFMKKLDKLWQKTRSATGSATESASVNLANKGMGSGIGKNVSGTAVKLSRKEKIFFLDAFASLVNAGIPVVKALQTIYFQSRNNRLRSMSLFLKREIETGENMAKTAAKLPNVFSPFDIAMFEMGDATGQL